MKHRSILLLRLALGILFLWSGVSKALSGFTAAGYLERAVSGPLASVFSQLAGNPLVDFLVVFGEIGIGVSLITGLFLGFACWAGILMMVLFYASTLPPEHGPINDQFVYAVVLWVIWREQNKLRK